VKYSNGVKVLLLFHGAGPYVGSQGREPLVEVNVNTAGPTTILFKRENDSWTGRLKRSYQHLILPPNEMISLD